MAARRVLRALLATSFLTVGAVQACDGDPEPTAPVSTAPDSVKQVVGAGGGTVGTPDGKASVVIPAGALPADVTITIQSNAAAPAPSSAAVVGGAYTFGPDGLVFLAPVTVTLGFDPVRMPAGTVATQIVVFTAPDGSTAYAPLPTNVTDPTHVSATTTHFSTDVPAVPAAIAEMDAASDAGTDAGTCYVSCLSKGSSSLDGSVTSSCECKATCDGHLYTMSCASSSCTCVRDGVQTGTTPGSCGTSTQNLSLYNGGCGFPGELAPPPDCVIPACAGTMSPGDAGTTSCSCSTTCKGHSYAMACMNDNCNCTTDGTSTLNDASTGACGNALTTYNNFCGYRGSYGDAGPSTGEGGTPPSISDGGDD